MTSRALLKLSHRSIRRHPSAHSTPLKGALLALAAAIGALLFTAAPASAHDDGFPVYTTSACTVNGIRLAAGSAEFVDYGPGAPGGGNNDDYIVLNDNCPDGHGVAAYAWQNGTYLGAKTNGNGSGTHVFWDPFFGGNLRGNDTISLKVCRIVDSQAVDCDAVSNRLIVDG